MLSLFILLQNTFYAIILRSNVTKSNLLLLKLGDSSLRSEKQFWHLCRSLFYLFLIIQLFGINKICAQYNFPQDSSSFGLSFSKGNNSWDWKGNFYYGNNKSDNFRYQIKDDFSTNLLIPSKNRKNWRDENEFDGFFYKDLSHFQTGIYSKSWILTDQQSFTTNQFSNHSIGIKSKYSSPLTKLIITPYAGYQRAENRSRIDWGWDLGLRGDLYDFELDDYRGDLSLNLDYDFYRNRQNSTNGVEIKFKTQFSQVAKDSITAKYDYSNKQYFSPTSDNLINVVIEEKKLHNILDYKLSRNSKLDIHTLIISRNILDNSRKIPEKDKLKFENRFNYFYYLSDFALNLGFDTFQETEDNTNIESDSKELHSNIRSSIQYAFTSKDILNFSFVLGKFQYDTPDTSNRDDRDKLSIVGGLQYIRNFSQALTFEIGAFTNLVHQVYIYKENSANNNWNRKFRLNSFITYKYGKFKNILKNEILANYTVYDFDEQLAQSQSFIFRKYILEDSLIFPIFPKMFTGINCRFELDDKGSFIKNEFAQKVLQSTSITYLDLFFRFKNIYLLKFDAGVTYYHRKDWRHIPAKSLFLNKKEITPYFRIRYNAFKKMRFFASIAYTFRDEISKKNITYTTGSLSLIQYF